VPQFPEGIFLFQYCACLDKLEEIFPVLLKFYKIGFRGEREFMLFAESEGMGYFCKGRCE
jgi:hypothetical protein